MPLETKRPRPREHAPQDAKEGLRTGTLFRGKLRINARGRSTAFVTADGGVLPSDIFLEDERAQNRALEGDTVRIDAASGVQYHEWPCLLLVPRPKNLSAPRLLLCVRRAYPSVHQNLRRTSIISVFVHRPTTACAIIGRVPFYCAVTVCRLCVVLGLRML